MTKHDRATLDAVRALQVNGFDPLAAARDYPRLEADNERLRQALAGIAQYDHVMQPAAFMHALNQARAALPRTTYSARVRQLEAEGLSTSDAQATADAERKNGRIFTFDKAHPND